MPLPLAGPLLFAAVSAATWPAAMDPFLVQYAETRGFQAGRPTAVQLTPDERAGRGRAPPGGARAARARADLRARRRAVRALPRRPPRRVRPRWPPAAPRPCDRRRPRRAGRGPRARPALLA